MTAFAADHADALADITAAGVAVTFTKIVPGTYDAATDTWTDEDDLSVAGAAIRVRGDPERYEGLGLEVDKAATLLFAATTYGTAPSLGATVSFGGVTYTVRHIDPVSPDGTPIIARVTVSL